MSGLFSSWEWFCRRFGNSRPQAGMRASAIVMSHPFPQDFTQMLLVERNHEIQTLTTNRSHQPFTIGVGLWRLHRSAQNLQPKCFQIFVNLGREDRVTIMDEKAIPVIAGNSFSELLQGPAGSRMSRDIAVQNTAASHFHDHEHVQHSEPGRDRDQKISSQNGLGVIADKGPPMLRRSSPPRSWISASRPIRSYRSRRDQDSELHR